MLVCYESTNGEACIQRFVLFLSDMVVNSYARRRFETKSSKLKESFVESKGNTGVHDLMKSSYADWSAGVWLGTLGFAFNSFSELSLESQRLSSLDPLISSDDGYPVLLQYDENKPGHNTALLRLTIAEFIRTVCSEFNFITKTYS
jgi:hypothetical protein